MAMMALFASFGPDSSIPVSSTSRRSEKRWISRSRSAVTFSPSRPNSNRVSRSEVRRVTSASSAMACSRRLRSCMVFWLFSGAWFQKSESEICCSILASCSFLLEESKIAPHSVSLLAERSVFSFVFFEGHELLFYQGRQIEQLAALSDVPAFGAPQGGLLASRLMDVPAIEILGL